MGQIVDRALNTFREFITADQPGSGPHKPVKADIRDLFVRIESSLAALGVASAIAVIYPTLAALEADTNQANGDGGLVYNDGSNNGLYFWDTSPTPDAWVKSDLILSDDALQEALDEALDALADALSTATATFTTPQVIGYPGEIPDGGANLGATWFVHNDPVAGDGTVTGIRGYFVGTNLCRVQRVRRINDSFALVGSEVTFSPAGTGYQEIALSIPVAEGDFLAFKPGAVTARYTAGSMIGLKSDANGYYSTSNLTGALPGYTVSNRLHFGFDLEVIRSQRHRIDIRNSDKIVTITDSYSADPYTLRGKWWGQKISDFSEWRFENAAVSGSTADLYLVQLRAFAATYDNVDFRDLGASHVLIRDGENTDAVQTISQAFGSWRHLGAAAASAGVLPIWSEQHVNTFASYVAGPIFKKLADEFGTFFFANQAYVARTYDATGRNAGFWSGQHFNVRVNDLVAGSLRQQLDQLGRPRQSLRIFRKRPGVSVSTVADLAYDRLFDRARLFKEIYSAQGGLLEASENLLDSIDTSVSSDRTLYPSEYAELQVGKAVAFDDYAVIEVILPSHRADGVRLYLSDDEVEVYVRDATYFGSGYPVTTLPSSNWRPLPVVDGYAGFYGLDVPGKLFTDKVTFLLHKTGGFELTEPHCLWYGVPGKPSTPAGPMSWPKGSELLAQPLAYSGGVIPAQWTQSGSPTTGTGGIGTDYPPSITGHALVSSANKIAQAVTWSAAEYDREVEIRVIAGKIIALVDPMASYPSAAAINRDTFDYEELGVEVVIGSQVIVLREKGEIGPWWREARFRTIAAAGSTGFTVRIGTRSADLAVVKASVKMVDG